MDLRLRLRKEHLQLNGRQKNQFFFKIIRNFWGSISLKTIKWPTKAHKRMLSIAAQETTANQNHIEPPFDLTRMVITSNMKMTSVKEEVENWKHTPLIRMRKMPLFCFVFKSIESSSWTKFRSTLQKLVCKRSAPVVAFASWKEPTCRSTDKRVSKTWSSAQWGTLQA